MEPDETLFLRVQGGDMAAFEALYERYETSLFGYLRAIVPDRRDAEEVFHDAFMAALRRPPHELVPGAFRAFLFRSARNLALNSRRAIDRRERRHVASADAPPSHAGQHAHHAARADRVLESRELDAALAVAVRRLPPPLGELYHLRTSGLSYEQIADVVEAPLGTVKSRMHQMVHVLREELRPWIVQE